MIKIGVLGIQGDVEEHILATKRALKDLGVSGSCSPVRCASEIKDLSGLIIPGGESTVIGRFIDEKMRMEINELIKRRGGIMGTCAGTVLLSKECGDPRVKSLDLLDITSGRNSYGGQRESFEKIIDIRRIGDFNCVFIRAPTIEAIGKNIRVLAEFEGKPIFVREGKILAITFHPELADNSEIHKYFLKLLV